MKILFNDILQNNFTPPELISPALSDTYTFGDESLIIPINKPSPIDCVGIGNCSVDKIKIIATKKLTVIDGGNAYYVNDGTQISGGNASHNGGSLIDAAITDTFLINYQEDGLYLLDKNDSLYTSIEIIVPKNTKIGRIALGKAVNIPTSIAKEPGFFTTAESRHTLSGQVIAGVGGYNYRALSLDSRYKINKMAMKELEAGYSKIAAGYPFFINLSDESYKLPFDKLYATEKNQNAMSFEGGIRYFLYSRRWFFKEAF